MPLSDYFDLSRDHTPLWQGEEPWEALKRLSSYLPTLKLGQIKGHIEEGAILVNPELISIGEGTTVESGAYIRGPCFIGRECEVRHGAYLRGEVLTGDRCVLGHATEVKHSIFLDDAHAAHLSYVGDSILGNRVNLGAGVKCANFRFDGKNIRMNGMETGMRKLGAIIGDDTQIGCNAVTLPGTLLGKKCHCYPTLTIRGSHASGSLIKTNEYGLQTENR